ncbi:hypothetical protein G7Y89_g7563 [Cudoniella acicularis]|uniref:Major facilitator superfamily (MFS) profile domain-containing protein n=1 Tax=Cudoniella acicularis TaxID=354080 RepID=A0A8H4RI76_9HELO|nr:hypothetical protein G7Y89_g7563 [Cudoniella acicularis]
MADQDETHTESMRAKDEGVVTHETLEEATVGPIVKVDSYKDEKHINLTWRSWMVVFVTCFAVFAQVYVVVAAGSVIGFIIRDLGDPAIAGWIIQGPLLMQSVLSPIVGRLSDVLDRKWLAIIPTAISFIGAVVSAKAESMSVLIGGGILVGFTLSTISIVQAIPSEVLPLKYRAIANGFAGIGGGIGGVIGNLGAGAATNVNASGWRNIFWIQAGFFALTILGLFFFYHPKRESDFPKMSLKKLIWACDPIGSTLFIVSATLMLLSLDWAGGVYAWNDVHVAAPLTIGLVSLVAFAAYEWKGRNDGLVAHVFFRGGPNFPLSVFAFAIEGAVNSITPLVVLNLGFEDTAWRISVRQLSFNLTLLGLIPLIMAYSTWKKDLKSPILVGFGFFLVVTICYACITPSMNKAQLGFNVLSGIGQSMPLTLLVAVVQFTAPHAYLSTATGLAFSARALGGAFGSAILDTIINGKIASDYAPSVSSAAINAGLPESSIPALLTAFATGQGFAKIPGINGGILGAATDASHTVYAAAYRLAWSSIIPFVVVAMVAICFLKGVKELMTEHVEATVELEEKALPPFGEKDVIATSVASVKSKRKALEKLQIFNDILGGVYGNCADCDDKRVFSASPYEPGQLSLCFQNYVIVGSGITGALTAYKLLTHNPSANITLLEARTACSGATGRNGGHCRAGWYVYFHKHLEKFGKEDALKMEKLEEESVANVAKLAKELDIDCDLRELETVDVTSDPADWESMLSALKARKEIAEESGTTFEMKHKIWSQEETRNELLVPEAVGAVSFRGYALSPYKFVCGVLSHCLKKGLNLQTNTPVLEISPSSNSDSNTKWQLTTPRGTTTTSTVILATNAYTPSLYTPLSNFITPTRAQISAVHPGSKIISNPLCASLFARTLGLTSSLSGDYMQVRQFSTSPEIVFGGGRRLGIGGGEQHTMDDSTVDPKIKEYLRKMGTTYFGEENWGRDGDVIMEWTGIQGYTVDRQPVIGEAPLGDGGGLWICAGFHGHGLFSFFLILSYFFFAGFKFYMFENKVDKTLISVNIGMGLTFQSSEAVVQMILGNEKEVNKWLPKCYKLSRVPGIKEST